MFGGGYFAGQFFAAFFARSGGAPVVATGSSMFGGAYFAGGYFTAFLAPEVVLLVADAGSEQSNRQAEFRALAHTEQSYEGDAIAAFQGTGSYNEQLIVWLQGQTGSSLTEINGLMQLFAETHGTGAPINWSSMGAWT